MKLTPEREEYIKIFNEKKTFKIDLKYKLLKSDFTESDIKIAVDYFCFNYSLASIKRKTGCKYSYLWQLIDRSNKIMIGDTEPPVIYNDEMSLPGCSFKELYLPVGGDRIEVVGKMSK